MKKNVISPYFLLICAAVAVCLLQVALARPVRRQSEQFSLDQIAFTMYSPLSGKYIRMQENRSVDATGDSDSPDAQWYIRMTENGLGFENCAYRGYFLAIASLGDATILVGEQVSAPLTRSEVEEMLLESESGEGSGEESSLSLSTTSNSEDFIVMSDWMFETTSNLDTLFKIVGGKQNCYLAVDINGQPESNLCDVPRSSEGARIRLLPYFKRN